MTRAPSKSFIPSTTTSGTHYSVLLTLVYALDSDQPLEKPDGVRDPNPFGTLIVLHAGR